jgi:hypothetical protein
MQNDKADKWAFLQADGSYAGAHETPEDAAMAALESECDDSVIVAQWRRTGPATLDIDELTEQCITRRDLELATFEPVPGVSVEPFAEAGRAMGDREWLG